jgi:hypothetical protein
MRRLGDICCPHANIIAWHGDGSPWRCQSLKVGVKEVRERLKEIGSMFRTHMHLS